MFFRHPGMGAPTTLARSGTCTTTRAAGANGPQGQGQDRLG